MTLSKSVGSSMSVYIFESRDQYKICESRTYLDDSYYVRISRRKTQQAQKCSESEDGIFSAVESRFHWDRLRRLRRTVCGILSEVHEWRLWSKWYINDRLTRRQESYEPGTGSAPPGLTMEINCFIRSEYSVPSDAKIANAKEWAEEIGRNEEELIHDQLEGRET